MTEHTDDGVVFIAWHGIEAAFLGIHIVGVVRAEPCAWAIYVGGPATWQPASNADNAKAALRRRVRDWYDALHTPLEPGQGERLLADQAGR